MPARIAIISTHPIQYHAPLFRKLAAQEGLEIRVFYNWEGATVAAYDPDFQRTIVWDIPLLEGYSHTFIPNTSRDPGTHHFRGLQNPDLIPCVEAWQPDAVLIMGWNYQSHLRALRAFHGRRPVFFRGDSTLLDERPGLRRLLRRAVLTWIYRHVDVALYVGTHNRAYFRAHGLRDEQLVWVPHAVDNERFSDPDGAYEVAARQWRSALGILEGDRVVLFAGKLESKKDPLLLLRAFQALNNPTVHLVYAGSGPSEKMLHELAHEYSNVHFIGFQNQSCMPVVYRLGDVFVLPSRGPGETWGLAVNEAMACGRPVVVSDRVGCASDLVEEGTNGIVFPAGDRGALRDALARLIDDPSLLSRTGAASLELIGHWSIDEQVRCVDRAVRQHVTDRLKQVESVYCGLAGCL